MKLYMKYVKIQIQTAMEHKASFWFTVLGQFLVAFTTFLGIYFMFSRFREVKGFTYAEVLLCFAVVLVSYSIAETFVRGFDTFSSMISNGMFDRIMVRPRNEIFQILGTKMELTRIGKLLQAAVMMLYAVNKSSIEWNALKIGILILMIAGGTALFSGLFILYASLCFFTTEGLEVMNIFTDGGREFGRYPMGIYGNAVLKFFTFVVPLAMVQYYPVLYLLGRTDNKLYGLCPLAGFLFLIPCLAAWKYGVNHYTSTGS